MPILILTFLSYFLSQPLDCTDLKQGTFRTVDDDSSVTIIIRNADEQSENYRDGERVSRIKIKWIDECTYLLFGRNVVEGIDPWPEMNSDTLKVRITHIEDGFYLTESEMLSKGWKMNQKVEIIK